MNLIIPAHKCFQESILDFALIYITWPRKSKRKIATPGIQLGRRKQSAQLWRRWNSGKKANWCPAFHNNGHLAKQVGRCYRTWIILNTNWVSVSHRELHFMDKKEQVQDLKNMIYSSENLDSTNQNTNAASHFGSGCNQHWFRLPLQGVTPLVSFLLIIFQPCPSRTYSKSAKLNLCHMPSFCEDKTDLVTSTDQFRVKISVYGYSWC